MQTSGPDTLSDWRPRAPRFAQRLVLPIIPDRPAVTPDDLRQLLQQPEGQTLEFKRNVPKDLRRIANLAGAFANTRGGTLVIGYDEAKSEGVGIASRRVDDDLNRVQGALRLVTPELPVTAQRVDVDGKAFIVVEVPKGSGFPYRSGGRVLQRRGRNVTPITRDLAVRRTGEIAETHVLPRPVPEPVPGEPEPDLRQPDRNLAEAIADQSALIERLTESTSWRKQLPIQLVFLVAGAVLGYLLAGLNPFGFG
jgi:Schlafen, AlbA_2